MKTWNKIGLLVLIATLVGGGWAGAVSTNDATVGGPGIAASSTDKDWVAERTVNFATYPCASNDVVQLLKVPAGTLVRFVQYSVLTTNADVGLRTLDIGTTALATQFKSDVSVAAVSAAVCATNFVYLSAATAIELEANDAITTGTIRVRVGGSDCSR